MTATLALVLALLALDPEPEPEAEHPEALYVWDLDLMSPAIAITAAEGAFARDVWLACEVKGAVLTLYVRLADVVNNQGSGAAGQAQVMPLHRAKMLTLGLDFDLEYHRVQYGFWMFQTSGPGAWSCWRGQ